MSEIEKVYDNTEEILEEPKKRIQYILDENKQLAEMLRDDAVVVEEPIKVTIKNAFEVFVQVKQTDNYWISNYGRCVNDIRNKTRKRFYEHKQGDVHYTIFEIYRTKKPIKKGKLRGTYEIVEERRKRDTSPAELVAETFLVKYSGCVKIWHKDGDKTNNWYKNLIYVSRKDYENLKNGSVSLEELNLEQEYIEYVNKASHEAFRVYNGIKCRCGGDRENHASSKCYDDAVMCEEWKENPRAFVKWYLEHYYEVEGERMAVDKDLLVPGNLEYAPDKCCILPQKLNTLLTNCKKHYLGEQGKETLPLGVRFDEYTGKYYGEIKFSGTEKSIKLSDFDKPEEAFEEYKRFKQADILLVIANYKKLIPDYVYRAFLKVEVQPY